MLFVSHAHFCNCTSVSASARKPHPVLYAYVCTKSDHLLACIEPRPSIDCCCRLQAWYRCSMSASYEIVAVQSTCIRPLQSHSHLFEARLGACKLAGATYSTTQHTYQFIPIEREKSFINMYDGLALLLFGVFLSLFINEVLKRFTIF